VTPLFFLGQYEVACDSKTRILIPAELRKRINPEVHGKDYVLVEGENGRPWLYPNLYYEYLASKADFLTEDIVPDMDSNDRDLLVCGFAHPVQTDSQGRILIPAQAMAWMKLEKQSKFYFVGSRDRIQIWNVASMESGRSELMARRSKVFAQIRSSRKLDSAAKNMELEPPKVEVKPAHKDPV
jgi:division/cell wall cluster transcriptional repressor MraZ